VVSELGEYETAHTYYEAALALYKTIDHFKGQSNCLNNLGVLSKGFGDYETARQYYTKSLEIDHKIGDQQGISVCLTNLGILADIEDDYEAAQRYYNQGLTIDRNIGDRRGEGVDLNNLGLLAMNIGDYVTAQKHYKASLVIRQEVGDRRGESRVRANLCFSYFGQGELDLARQYGAEAVDIARQIEGQYELALSLLHLVHVLLAQNEVTAAQTAYQEAYDLWQAGKQHRFAIEPLAGLAQTALQQNNLINALDYVDSMLRYLAENELDKTTTYPFWVYLTCVQVLQAAQDERAAAVLNEALSKLKATAAKIAAPAQRALYWQIPAHQRLLALAGE
jgi:tetratricopeptide (TPR) repeat protein